MSHLFIIPEQFCQVRYNHLIHFLDDSAAMALMPLQVICLHTALPMRYSNTPPHARQANDTFPWSLSLTLAHHSTKLARNFKADTHIQFPSEREQTKHRQLTFLTMLSMLFGMLTMGVSIWQNQEVQKEQKLCRGIPSRFFLTSTSFHLAASRGNMRQVGTYRCACTCIGDRSPAPPGP
jgi:hypothetical protein